MLQSTQKSFIFHCIDFGQQSFIFFKVCFNILKTKCLVPCIEYTSTGTLSVSQVSDNAITAGLLSNDQICAERRS